MNDKAPDGKVFVCQACGKVSRYRYGFDDANKDYDAQGRKYSSRGWDESCMLNAEITDVAELSEDLRDRANSIAPA
jgi:hypothetical protein